jgi:hypothetical protein
MVPLPLRTPVRYDVLDHEHLFAVNGLGERLFAPMAI